MPASLPTSASSPSASSHYKQALHPIPSPPLHQLASPPPSVAKAKANRPSLFGFGSSGSGSGREDKRKLDISLPLTRGPDAMAGSSTGVAVTPGQSAYNGSHAATILPPSRKPTLEVRTQNQNLIPPSDLSALSPPSVYPPSASPASSSYVMVTPASSAQPQPNPPPSPHPFAAVAAKSNAPVPPLKVGSKKSSRPAMVITHPHTYVGAESDSSLPPPPRRMSHVDVAPPTPPPTGPLPRVPPAAAAAEPGLGVTLNLVVPSPLNPRAPSPFGKNGQRGKDQPFNAGRGQGVERERVGKLDGFEERMKVPRYRELYGAGRTDGPSTSHNAPPPRPQPSRSKHYENNPFPMVYTDSEDDDDEHVADSDHPKSPEEVQKEMSRIRGRFNAEDRERFSAASVPVTEPGDGYDSFAEEDSMAAPHQSFEYEQLHSFSFSNAPRESGQSNAEQLANEAAHDAPETVHAEGNEEEIEIYSPVHVELNEDADDDKSIYADEDRTAGRQTMYDLEGRLSGDTESHYWDEGRISRYSAAPSVYSVLDNEQSEVARQRFLKKVAAMYGEGADVPPMPTLATSHSETNMIKEPGVGRRRMI